METPPSGNHDIPPTESLPVVCGTHSLETSHCDLQLDAEFVISAIKEGYAFKQTDAGIFLVKDEKYLALVVHPKAKLSGELQELAGLLDLKVDYDSPKPAVFEVISATEGWIQSTFADATSFQAQLDLACPDEFEMLPGPLDVQDESLLREDIVVSTR